MTVKIYQFCTYSRKNRRMSANADEEIRINDVFSCIRRIEKENCLKRNAETLLIPTFMLTRTFFAHAPVFLISCSFHSSSLYF